MFPARYYLNDFEFAVVFDFDSDPKSRFVSGLPLDRTGRTGEYGRELAPEMKKKEPYCPFKADMWQLGSMFFGAFEVGHIKLRYHSRY